MQRRFFLPDRPASLYRWRMINDDPEPWWAQQDADAAWITRQETVSAALRQRGKGWLAATAGKHFPLQVCRSRAGYYIGTLDENGLPCSRESEEYWPKAETAQAALTLGLWTQKLFP